MVWIGTRSVRTADGAPNPSDRTERISILALDPVVGMLPGERREIDRIRKCDKSFAKFSDEYVLAILRGGREYASL